MNSLLLDKSMMVSFEPGFHGRKVNISSSSANSRYLITRVHLFCLSHISFNQLVILFNLLTLLFNVQTLILFYLLCYEIYLSHFLMFWISLNLFGVLFHLFALFLSDFKTSEKAMMLKTPLQVLIILKSLDITLFCSTNRVMILSGVDRNIQIELLLL